MSSRRPAPSQELLHEWLDYNCETGIFLWKKEPRPSYPILGKEAGCLRADGYKIITLRGGPATLAHRLAWIYVYGRTVGGAEIDHIDRNRSNNAIANLRLATTTENGWNKTVGPNNRSGLKGAYFHAAHNGKKWRSQLQIGGRTVFLGYFHTPEEAHAAYFHAAKKYYGEFARAI